MAFLLADSLAVPRYGSAGKLVQRHSNEFASAVSMSCRKAAAALKPVGSWILI